MDESGTERDPLEMLAEEFIERQRRGESPSVEEYVAAHPDLVEGIRELFPAIAAMERLKARGERSSEGLASLGPIKLERLGDFRIIREIGRGGMGIVFEAEQESLGRRVALKVLPRQALLEHRYLARFRREAKIASHLHHTNIVQVYGVGEQEGFHYYVMQFVRGVGLDKIIQCLHDLQAEDSTAPGRLDRLTYTDELLETVIGRVAGNEFARRPILSDPQFYRFVAGVGEQAAGALAYAHEQGTLHRDIKPANLLLDVQGTVWVADFGLARAADAPEVTQAGDLTGTLRYLAPERLHGQTDARSDIYSLGLTLYELLTLRPAYDQTDRSALVQQVAQESPSRPRATNPAVPRDLETIILKAIAREPQHRYATAAEMGHDLRRFLEDRPVLARRIGPAEQLWRWCRRNKAVASLAASTLLLIVAAAIVATVGYVHTRKALASEADERRRAEAVATVAGEALDRVFSRLGPSRDVLANLTLGGTPGTRIQIVGQPAISQETAALLEEMLPFYDRLAEQTGNDVGLQRRAAGARRRIGDIRQRLGQYDAAIAAYRRAIGMYSSLAAARPGNPTLSVSMAEAYNEVGKSCLLMRKVADAQEAHRQALNLLEAPGGKATASARFELARTHFFLGQRVPNEPGAKPPASERSPDRRPPPPDETDDRPPAGNRPPREDRPGPPGSEPDPGRKAQDQHLEQAVTLLTALNQEQPKNPDCRHLLALCYRELDAPARQGQPNTVDKAIEILEALVKDFPLIADYRLDLCETYAAAGTRRPGPNQRIPPVVEQHLRKALALSQQLTGQHPNMPEYLASQARIHHRLGEVLRQSQRLDDAEESDRKALDIQAQLAKSFPEVVTYQVWEAAFRNSLADLLLRRDKLTELRTIADTNITKTTQLLRDHPELGYLHALLMETHRTLAAALRRSGEADQAAKAEAQAEMHRSKLGEEYQIPPDERKDPRP